MARQGAARARCGAVWVEGRRRQRAETSRAPTRVWDRAIGAAARMQRRGGGGRAGAGDADGRRCSVDPHLRSRGRSSRVKVSAGVGRRAPADMRCLARQKGGARPGRESVSGVVRRDARRARAGLEMERRFPADEGDVSVPSIECPVLTIECVRFLTSVRRFSASVTAD